MISSTEHMSPLAGHCAELAKTLLREKMPDWVNRVHEQGLTRFRELGFPSAKDEEWKYTSISPILAETYSPAASGRLIEEDAFRDYAGTGDVNVVFVNGLFSKELSNFSDIPPGIKMTTLQDSIAGNDIRLKELFEKYDPKDETVFIALNKALAKNGVYIQVDDNVISKKTVHILHITSLSDGRILNLPRSFIRLGDSSEATILESHIAFTDEPIYFANALTDIFLAENATLHYCKAQRESLKAYHIGHTRVWQDGNSNFDGFSFAAGSAIARNNLDVTLNGEGANAALDGLYSVCKNQHVDNHTSVDHRVPHCTSTQLYKGILHGSARAVFNGKIFVRPLAQQTNAYQLNKNLLLGKDCRIDTKPQLEIFADDVKCTHGATIGQIEADEMFYLQTRGIPRKAAAKMLVRGFADVLLNTIKNDGIRRKLNVLMEPSFEVL